MADAFYDNFRNIMVSCGNDGVHGAIDLGSGGNAIKIILYDEGTDALNLADQDLADITSGARVATSAAVGSQTVGTAATGAFDHADVTFSSVTGASVESLTYFNDTPATEATKPLIVNIDSATGLPVTPNGGNITWTVAAGGVFQIT